METMCSYQCKIRREECASLRVCALFYKRMKLVNFDCQEGTSKKEGENKPENPLFSLALMNCKHADGAGKTACEQKKCFG